jgi:fructokinase
MGKMIRCFGEALVDMISEQAGVSLCRAETFRRCAGGAPANVAVGLARLGVASGFIGMVGDDHFGRYLESFLQENRVDTSGMVFSEKYRTSLAFVSRNESGEREFAFFREPGADTQIKLSDIPEGILQDTEIFHFGSISLIDSPIRETLMECLKMVRQAQIPVTFDPNLRLNLWPDAETARKTILDVLNQVDLIKVSEEELFFLTGEKDIIKGLLHLSLRYRPVVILTRGEKGSMTMTERGYAVSAPSTKVNCIDTTGAGDAFMAGLLAEISQKRLFRGGLDVDNFYPVLEKANYNGAMATTRIGAL